MKKRFLTLFVCICMLCASLCACAAPAAPAQPAEAAVEAVQAEAPQQTPAPEKDAAGKTAKGWIASDVLGSVTTDTQVELQDDFHAAVNKDWMAVAEIPEGQGETMPAIERSMEIQEQMRVLLTDETQDGHEAELLRTLYEQYTDMDTRNAVGVAPLQAYIEEIQALSSIEDVRDYVAGYREHLYEVFAVVGARTDYKNSTAYLVALDAPSFSLGDADEYRSMSSVGERMRDANEAMLVEVLVYAGMAREEAQKVSDDFFALETEVAKASMGTEASLAPDFYEKSYNPMSLEELEALAPNYPVAAVLAPYIEAGIERFNAPDIAWLERMNELFVEENLEGWKAWLIRSAVRSLVDIMDQRCMELLDARNSAIYGVEIKTSAEDAAYEACASRNSPLAMAAGRMYVEAYVSPETKTELEAIIEDVLAVYRRRLENNDWLTDATRAKAIEKLDNLKVRVAYPDDWSLYDYSGLSFKGNAEGGSLVENSIAISAYALAEDVKKAAAPVDSRRWLSPPQTVNAAYSPNDNSINIFAGILGNAFYDADAPIETKLGTIGAVIGHEISHGFDDSGSQFDKDGKLSDWWTKEDKAAFEARTAKVSAYFSQFEPLPGVFANGELEKGEAVADLGGVSCMLEIAKDIPDFDYALFFESHAKMWRRARPAETVEIALRTDPHPLNYLRTNIIVQQFDEFYETYGIEEGDGMYLAPEERLSVW